MSKAITLGLLEQIINNQLDSSQAKVYSAEDFEKIITLSLKHGMRPITLVLCTNVRLNKKSSIDKSPNPLGDVWKIVVSNALLNADYEKRINKEREKTGLTPDFQKGERVWGEKENNAIVKRGDQVYLTITDKKDIKTAQYVEETPSGFILINKEKFKEYQPPFSPPSTGVDIKPRSIKFENIIAARFDKVSYIIDQSLNLHKDKLAALV